MFDKLVQDELEKVRKKIRPFNSWEEAYGILLEEIDEFQEEVFKKARNRDRANTLKELYQIAGICIRAREDLIEEENRYTSPFVDTKYNSHAECLGHIWKRFYRFEQHAFDFFPSDSGISQWLSELYNVCKNSAISLGLVES